MKFNSDGDGLGRYSVYQYQHSDVAGGGWDYNWIGEFGEKDNFKWDSINSTGEGGQCGH